MIECVNQISTVDTRSAFVDSKQTQSKLKANMEWTQNNLNFVEQTPSKDDRVFALWVGSGLVLRTLSCQCCVLNHCIP